MDLRKKIRAVQDFIFLIFSSGKAFYFSTFRKYHQRGFGAQRKKYPMK